MLCFINFLDFHFNSNKRITGANQNSRLGSYNNTNLILKTTEWMIYKVLSLHYLHLFPPLAAVSLSGITLNIVGIWQCFSRLLSRHSTVLWSPAVMYCWFSHDVTKIQTTKISILLRFYFHGVLEQLKTNFQTNFRFKRFLGFVIEYAWISKLLRDAAFTWRPRELSFR